MLAISLSPEEALDYLARIHSILIVNAPSDLIINYRGQVLVHSWGFPDDPELKQGCHEILEEFGFCADTFPAFAIQGVVTVCEVIKYDALKFERDRALHDSEIISSEVWGIRFEDTYILEEPVLDIIPPINVENGDFWLPETPAQIQGFDLAMTRYISRLGMPQN